MSTYKTIETKVKCSTCGEKFYRFVSGTREQRDSKLQDEQTCKVCYAKSLPRKNPLVEIYCHQAERQIEIRIFNSYDIKELLKTKNYTYDEYRKCWSIKFPTGNNSQELLTNFEPYKIFINENKFEISKDRLTQRLFNEK